MRTTMTILLASTAAIALPLFAQAQQPTGRTGPGAQQQQQGAAAERSISDQRFTRRAGLTNLIEIETSELALQRTSRQDIRSYAQRMVRDHQNALKQLRSAASGLDIPASLDGEYGELLRNLRESDNFDDDYVSFQIDAHEDAIDLFSRYGQSGQQQALRQFARQTLPTLREHLRLAEALSGDSSAQASASSPQQGGVARAQVLVQQQAPEVTVDQARPHIIVRQPPPMVTIEQRQPEIIVRMPPPEVDVSTSKPQVSVRMQEPRVTVDREGRQRVRIIRSEQPQVTFERTGEPQVQVRQSRGEPRVRYEQTQRPGAQQNASASNAGRQAGMNDDERDTTGSLGARQSRSPQNAGAQNSRAWVSEAQRLSASDQSTPATGQRRQFVAGNMLDESVYNGRGQELGTIERLVETPAGDRQFIVLSSGGFLGLFEDTVALPIERLRYENGRFVIRGLTEADIEQMPDWEDRLPDYRDVSDNERLDLISLS